MNTETVCQLLVEESNDGFYVSDAHGIITYANPGLAQILGFEQPDDLIGRNYVEFIPPGNLKKIKDKFQQLLISDDGVQPLRSKVVRKDMAIVPVEIRPRAIKEGRNVVGTCGIVQDITHWIDVESKLKEKENRFSALFENANAAIFTMDGEVFTDCNQMTVAMFGCEDKSEILGHYPWEFSPEYQPDGEDSNSAAKKKIQEALDGIPQRFYWKHSMKDSALFDAEVMLNAIEINNQVMIQAIVNDVSSRKKAEEALQKSEEQFRSLFENVSIGIYRASPEGSILMANPAAIKMLGCRDLSELQKSVLEQEAFGPSYTKHHFKDLLEQGGEIIGKEAVWKRMDGTDVYVRENARVIRDSQGNLLYYEGTIEDFSERKMAENQLIENENRLIKLNATKDKFFSIIAHDLKSPFNSIMGFSSLLVEDADKNDHESVINFAGIIMKSSQKAMDLLTNLLEWARSQTGHMNYNPEYLELVSVINKSLDFFTDVAQQKKLIIESRLPKNLPVLADRAMIDTILRNLISNAIKFSHPEGKIIVSAKAESNELVMCVCDNGVGIDQDTIGRLFKIEDSFSTAGTHNEMGTGLGLLLCAEFVRIHKGRIWVDSAVGKGSTFHFAIPLRN